MSNTEIIAATPRRELRKVAAATIIGTTVEWYDFFLYANAAGIIFAKLFFEPAGAQFATLLSFATVGVSFLFRPLGAFLAGHYGDVLGRRAMLVITLILMGASTTLIGVLPTYGQIGLLAPVLLVLLRVLQGLSAGGEWGGAVLMAVEHAPTRKRGLFGAFPQAGVPLGMLLAAGMIALMTGVIAPGDAFLEWGWRVPFLLSFVLVIVGFVVRRSVEESPVFKQIKQDDVRVKVPIVKLFRHHWLLVILVALVFIGNNGPGYLTTGGFLQAYAANTVGIDLTAIQLAVVGSSAVWLITTMIGGALSDRIGRKKTFMIGLALTFLTLFGLFPLIETANPLLAFTGMGMFSIGLGFTYGSMAAHFAELFPASVRYSGVSIAYALGSILGGAFAPLIAQALVQATGTTWSVVWYMVAVLIVSFIAVSLLRDRTGIPLSHEHEEEQATGAFIFEREG